MINAVSELPAIVINGLYELSDRVGKEPVKNRKDKDPGLSIDAGDKNKKDELSSKTSKGSEVDTDKYPAVDYSELAAKLKEMLKNNDLMIEFSYDKEINKMIMKLIDEKKDEVVKQFPPEIAIKIARIVASTLGNGQVTDARI